MLQILETEIGSDYSKELHSMLIDEWQDMRKFESEKFGIKIPNLIVAIVSCQVIGGASFTSYKEPDGSKIVIWLNALYVRSRNGNQGIATQIIQASQGVASDLYALTDIPDLYTKVGWQIVKADENGTVVKQAK